MVIDLFAGIGAVLEWHNLALIVLGLVIGIVIGAIPGLNVPLAVAITLPVTFYLEPITGIGMLIGIYKGGTYGGSLSAVLINVPGTPAAAATALDGHRLTKQGKAGKALKMSLYASGIGSLMSDLALIFLSVPVAVMALSVGPPENFALGVFALTLIAVLSQGNMLKGLLAGLLGVFLASFGLDPLTGSFRLTFGVGDLAGGWTFLSLIIGVFAVSEAIDVVQQRLAKVVDTQRLRLDSAAHRLTREDWRKTWVAILRSGPIGVVIGAVPGLGSAIAAFFSYGVARSLSKEPELYGEGSLEGVAAAEAANNGVTSSTFIPLMTLGIPGDVITAIMLGAFMVHGLVPGPGLFQQHSEFVASFFVMMLVSTFLLVVIARLGMPLFLQAAKIPDRILFPIVIVIAFTGTFVATNSFFDMFATLGFGVLGFAMRRFGFPIAPLLIGFILGPLVEVGLRQSLFMSRGSFEIFVTRPIPLIFLSLAAVTLAWVAWQEFRTGRARRRALMTTSDPSSREASDA
jgi:putative tricarboxylic transport membrane protein